MAEQSIQNAETPVRGDMTQRSNSEATGNTRGRGWAMTIFNEAELQKFLDLNGVRYQCYGEEICPTTGKTHWQAYVYFNNQRTFKATKKKLPTTHIEKARGTPKQNREYCKKDGKFVEDGELPTQGKISGSELLKMTDEEIIEQDARCHRAYMNAREILKGKMNVSEWNKGKKVDVYYYYGVSGCGKSTKVGDHCEQTYGDVRVCIGSYSNGFYNLSDVEADVLIMDDWRDSDMKPSEFVKMIDYRPQQMNIKHGKVLNRFKAIYITSVRPIDKIYQNMKRRSEHMEQWKRRMHIEHLCIDDCECDEEEEDDIDLSNFQEPHQ